MSWLTATALIVLAASPRQVVLAPGETLEQVAARELGDATAAEELRALNKLPAGKVAPGTPLALPGKDRERAISALGAARNALGQLDGGAGSADAQRRLEEAERLFAQAQYERAAAAADEAWRIVSELQRAGASFSVEVEPSGETRVTSRSGQPVRVEAQGVLREVAPGTLVKVARGEAPSEPARPPEAPVALWPKDRARLQLRPDPKGLLGPVQLRWKPVSGARSYQVEVLPAAEGGESLVLTTTRASLSVPALPPGLYWWKVKAVGAEALASAPSDPRSFELAAQKLKLELRQTDWK